MLKVKGTIAFLKIRNVKDKEVVDFTLITNYEGKRPELYNLQVWSDSKCFYEFINCQEGDEIELLVNLSKDAKIYPVGMLYDERM